MPKRGCSPVASRAVDSNDDSLADRVAAALRGGEWKEDNFEKTFGSGTILTHFLVNERWRCGGDFGFAATVTADLGESQEMHDADDGLKALEPVTFGFGRCVGAVTSVGIWGVPVAFAPVIGLILTVARLKQAF